MFEFNKYEDIEDYLDFIEEQTFAGRSLSSALAEIQHLYKREKQPWVVAFSGGKDSTAILTLVYFALLGLKPEDRINPVHVVFCDTLAEVPVYLHKVMNALNSLKRAAKLAYLYTCN